MANQDITFTPDPDTQSISSDVAGFAGLLVSTQIPTRADGSLELGDITEQSECTLQALKVALERADDFISSGFRVELSWQESREGAIQLARTRGYAWWIDLSARTALGLENERQGMPRCSRFASLRAVCSKKL